MCAGVMLLSQLFSGEADVVNVRSGIALSLTVDTVQQPFACISAFLPHMYMQGHLCGLFVDLLRVCNQR